MRSYVIGGKQDTRMKSLEVSLAERSWLAGTEGEEEKEPPAASSSSSSV